MGLDLTLERLLKSVLNVNIVVQTDCLPVLYWLRQRALLTPFLTSRQTATNYCLPYQIRLCECLVKTGAVSMLLEDKQP